MQQLNPLLVVEYVECLNELFHIYRMRCPSEWTQVIVNGARQNTHVASLEQVGYQKNEDKI